MQLTFSNNGRRFYPYSFEGSNNRLQKYGTTSSTRSVDITLKRGSENVEVMLQNKKTTYSPSFWTSMFLIRSKAHKNINGSDWT
jgi:hypothetical protein